MGITNRGLCQSNIAAAVLAGGLGKRLRPLTRSVPKPLVRVRGKPFISYLLSRLSREGVQKCVLLTGYKHSMVQAYCGSGGKWGMEISYSREKSPLGTGGALAFAASKIRSTVLILNGDTYVDIPLRKFLAFHRKKHALATILTMRGNLEGRGEVRCSKSGMVTGFFEKKGGGFGAFNTGAYLVEPAALELLKSACQKKFSLEKQGFPLLKKMRRLYAFSAKGKFLDIGTFESLAKAGKFDFKKR